MRDDPRRKATASNLFLERHSTGAEETNRILVRRSRLRQVERACAYVRTVLEVAGARDLPTRSAPPSAAMRSTRRRSSPLLQGHGGRADVARTLSLCLIERPEMAGLGPQLDGGFVVRPTSTILGTDIIHLKDERGSAP